MPTAAFSERGDQEPVRLLDPDQSGSDPTATSWPVPLTRLVGREREIETVLELFREESIRLVTLTGPGGVGKTRLAIEIATRLSAGRSGRVVFVPLAPVGDPALLPAAVATALDVRETSDQPLGERLRQTLHDWDGLLILDNFEHVLTAAPFVSELLAHCPHLMVLATSRAPLRLGGEQEFSVPPLAVPADLPSLAEAAVSPAVALFLQRAAAVRSGFALSPDNLESVVAICRRLDGLPLAIELAAVRAKVLAPAALLARLSHRLQLLTGGRQDLPARQQTMRDAVGWSYDLLSAKDKVLFREIAVFSGGFALEAAEAVAGELALDGLSALVDESLLRGDIGPPDDEASETRFAMLETIREYALERLATSDDEKGVRDRHAAYFLSLAEEASVVIHGPDQPNSLRRLTTDIDNIRTALVWFDSRGERDCLLRFVCALVPFWYLRGHFREAAHWCDRTISSGTARDDVLWANALLGAGRIDTETAAFETGRHRLTEALRIFTALGDKRSQARTLLQTGLLEEMSGDDLAAVPAFEASLALYREIDVRHGIAHALVNLGDAAFRLGDLDRSAVWTDEALAISRQFADPFLVSMALSNAGQLALRRIDAAAAVDWYRETLVVSAEMEHQLGIADGLSGMAGVALLAGRPETAARLLGAAASLGESVGVHLLPHHGQFNAALSDTRERLGEVRFRVFWDEGRALTLARATEEALSIESPSAPKPGKDVLPFGLTQREMDVLHLIVAGLPDKQIANALFMSPRTAQKHAATIFAKLGVSSRTAATALALRSGIASNE